MRLTRIVKALPKAKTLVALFGMMIGLTVPAGSLPGRPHADEYHENEECGNAQSTCNGINFEGTQAGCNANKRCVSFSNNACYTCRPTNPVGCTNSDARYGHITCPGLCDQPLLGECTFTVYACKL